MHSRMFTAARARRSSASGHVGRGRALRAEAKPKGFDEGAAQVANLLSRDKGELTGEQGIGSGAYSEFGQDAGEDTMATIEDFPEAFQPGGGNDQLASTHKGPRASSTPAASNGAPMAAPAANASASTSSMFGKAAGAASPFGGSSRRAPGEGPLSPTLQPDPVSKAPWWSKITRGQIVLACTFTFMTLSMLATVLVVAKTGAIHFNDS